jgi:hypothetical protein
VLEHSLGKNISSSDFVRAINLPDLALEVAVHRVHSKIALLIPLFLLTLTCLSFSQGPSPPRQEGLTQEAIHQLLEGPQTALRGLKERGISFQAMLVYDWSKSLASETDAKGGFGRYSFDLLMPVDAEKLFGLKDSAGLLRFKHHMRHFGETYDEEAQVYSNIDANSRTTLYEIWLQKKFFSEHLRMKVGKIDANTEFATVSTAADFLNSSMGFSPTILVFPTYPEPKFGINVFLGRPSATYVLGAGIFRTVDATMSILEPARNWNSGPGEHGGRASFGYWRLDGKIDLTDGTRSPGTQGLLLCRGTIRMAPDSTQRTRIIGVLTSWLGGRAEQQNHATHRRGRRTSSTVVPPPGLRRNSRHMGEVFLRTPGRLRPAG